MTASRRRTTTAVLLLVGGSIALAAWVAWVAAHDPDIPFLTSARPAEWILFPGAPSAMVHRGEEVETAFRKSFSIESPPPGVVLSARCFHAGTVALNGAPLRFACGDGSDWKRTGRGDISSLLHSGTNELEVSVRSRFGPPALWLSIDGPGVALHTDGTWEVRKAESPVRPARLATVPMDRWTAPVADPSDPLASLATAPRVLETARHALPVWGVFALAGTALLLIVRRLRARLAADGDPHAASTLAITLAAVVTLLWAVLAWRNQWVVLGMSDTPGFELPSGFDVKSHLEYVAYVGERGALPFADQGWEMYQPPLYYLMAAGFLKAFGHPAIDSVGVALLRLLNIAGGLVLLSALFGSLRLIFPESPRRQVLGFVLGAFLPAQLYMTHYVSNEIWSAAWASAAIGVALLVLLRRPDSLPLHVLLGALMGAALLTKFSTLIVVVVLLAAIALPQGQSSQRRRWRLARTAGVAAVTCLVVCGWHFLRVARRFGNPLTGNWDAASGFSWWLDPGYHTLGYYTGFGTALRQPIFAAFHSFADALYSTLWGDGMIGGSADAAVWLPWNMDLMLAGYLLALLPTLAIVAGTVAATARLVRAPRSEWLLILGVLGGTAFGVFYMTLRLPFYAQAKAFYGLSALVPLAILGAWGMDLAGGRAPAVRFVLDVALGVWALNAFASFWIRV